MIDFSDVSRGTAKLRLNQHEIRAQAAAMLLNLVDAGALSLNLGQRNLIAAYMNAEAASARFADEQVNPEFDPKTGEPARD